MDICAYPERAPPPANIEIGEEVGDENIFFFGALTPQVEDIRHEQMYRHLTLELRLEKVVQSIQNNNYGDSIIFEPLLG